MCSCDMGELPSFFQADYIKARKEHNCCECPFPIEKGERYFNARGKWDDFAVFKRHTLCVTASEIDEHCTSAFGNVRADMIDCELDRGHPARRAWGRHLWRFRKHPKARNMRLTTLKKYI